MKRISHYKSQTWSWTLIAAHVWKGQKWDQKESTENENKNSGLQWSASVVVPSPDVTYQRFYLTHDLSRLFINTRIQWCMAYVLLFSLLLLPNGCHISLTNSRDNARGCVSHVLIMHVNLYGIKLMLQLQFFCNWYSRNGWRFALINPML